MSVTHSKNSKGKEKVLIFNAQAFKGITKGKTILHIVCRARETVTLVLRQLSYLHPLIGVSTTSHWIICLRTSQ